MIKPTKIDAILSLRPDAKVTVRGDEIEWHDTGLTQPTESEVTSELSRMQSEYNSKSYQLDRAKEYPDIGDQLDALFHAGVFPADMAAKIQAVKDKYPKPR